MKVLINQFLFYYVIFFLKYLKLRSANAFFFFSLSCIMFIAYLIEMRKKYFLHLFTFKISHQLFLSYNMILNFSNSATSLVYESIQLTTKTLFTVTNNAIINNSELYTKHTIQTIVNNSSTIQ